MSNKLRISDDDDINDAATVIGAIAVGGAIIYGASKLKTWWFGGEKNDARVLSQKGWELFGQAERAFQNSEFEKAEKFARLCQKLSPNNSDINNLIANIQYFQNKDLEEAVLLAKRAIQFASNRYAEGIYYGTLSDVYYLKGEWQESINAGNNYLQILKENNHQPFPPNQWSIWKLAICYFEIQEYKESLKKYQEALDVEPQSIHNYKILLGIAQAKNKLEMYLAAVKHYNYALEELEKNQSLSKETKDIEACMILNDLGVTYYNLNDEEKSLKCYSNAISRYEKNPFPFANLASSFAEKGNLEKMRYFLESTIPLLDANFTHHQNLINNLVNSQKIKENTECFHTMISLFESNNLISKKRADIIINTNVGNQEFHVSEKTREELKYLISKNEIHRVIEELMKLTFKRKSKYNYVVKLSGKLERVEKEGNLDLISKEEEDLQRSRIQKGLMEIIDRLTD